MGALGSDAAVTQFSEGEHHERRTEPHTHTHTRGRGLPPMKGKAEGKNKARITMRRHRANLIGIVRTRGTCGQWQW